MSGFFNVPDIDFPLIPAKSKRRKTQMYIAKRLTEPKLTPEILYAKERMNLNLIFIQIHNKYTIGTKANPNFSCKVALGAGRKLKGPLPCLPAGRRPLRRRGVVMLRVLEGNREIACRPELQPVGVTIAKVDKSITILHFTHSQVVPTLVCISFINFFAGTMNGPDPDLLLILTPTQQ